MVSTAFVGIVLPLEFLYQVDGYLAYLRPWELIAVFAWAWPSYALLGLMIWGTALLFAIPFAKPLAKPIPALALFVGSWLSVSCSVLAFIKIGKYWSATQQYNALDAWLSAMKWEVVIATLLGSAVWMWRRPNGFEGLKQLAQVGAAGGLIVTLGASLSALLRADTSPNPQIRQTSLKTQPKPPHIVLLTVDALAANHLSLYGYARPTTPNFESVARQASVFTRFYANSNFTTPAINSLINGSRPWSHRAIQLEARVKQGFADRGLVARLKTAGYQTFAVATSAVAAPFHNSNDFWFDRAVYSQVRSVREHVYQMVGSHFPLANHAFRLVPLVPADKVWDSIDRLLIYVGIWSAADHFYPEIAFSAARRLIEDRDQAKSLFLWVHLMPPHAPYATPAPFVGQFDGGLHARTQFDSSPPKLFFARLDKDFPARYVGRYDEAITYVDYHIGSFIEWLKHRRLFDDALLVITADHGESFSHGYGEHAGPMLHDDLIRIPLIIKEQRQRSGKRVETLSEQIDLMPTVLDLAGIPIEGPVEGRSLKAALRGGELDGAVFSMNFEQSNRFGALHTGVVAMIEERWKYVRYLGHIKYPHMPKLEDSMYDLQADPDEKSNLIAVEPVVAARMRAAIEEQLRHHGEPTP